jgi:hypothetical protein
MDTDIETAAVPTPRKRAAKADAPQKVVKAPKAAKAPKAPRAAKPAAAADATKKARRSAAEESAKDGKLPTPPDFSAETHSRFRGKLDKLAAMVKAKDIAGLKAESINPVSSSPKALDRYRNHAVIALEARAAKSRKIGSDDGEPI